MPRRHHDIMNGTIKSEPLNIFSLGASAKEFGRPLNRCNVIGPVSLGAIPVDDRTFTCFELHPCHGYILYSHKHIPIIRSF